VRTTVNDEDWTSDLVPLLLLYRVTVEDGREDLVNQLAVRRPEPGGGDPFVDNTLGRGVVAEVDPVQAVHNVRRQLIRTIVRARIARFLEKDELFSVVFVLQGSRGISRSIHQMFYEIV